MKTCNIVTTALTETRTLKITSTEKICINKKKMVSNSYYARNVGFYQENIMGVRDGKDA
jgi:hypothetical protein